MLLSFSSASCYSPDFRSVRFEIYAFSLLFHDLMPPPMMLPLTQRASYLVQVPARHRRSSLRFRSFRCFAHGAQRSHRQVPSVVIFSCTTSRFDSIILPYRRHFPPPSSPHREFGGTQESLPLTLPRRTVVVVGRSVGSCACGTTRAILERVSIQLEKRNWEE